MSSKPRRPKNSYKRGDRFTKKAKNEGYLARSVYKLEEIDRRFKLHRGGQRVLDLGCFPGSWSAYVQQRIGPKGVLVGVDLQEPQGIEGLFMAKSVYDVDPQELLDLAGGPFDVVLSDMAPRTTGDRFGDHVRQIDLVRRAHEVSVAVLKPGGDFVFKVFEGQEAHACILDIRRDFDKLKRVRPEAVRKESLEFFCVATGLKPRE